MKKFRFLTSGESHGKCLTAIIEGVPAGLRIKPEVINEDLKKRQSGYGRGARMQIENDTVEIKAGEFVYDQKNNIKIAKVCSELKRNYEKLGRLCYRKCKNLVIDDNEFDATMLKIETLKVGA